MVKTIDNDLNRNSWNETRNFWPRDQLLRLNGYRLEHRRKGEEAKWSMAGHEYSESEALARCGEVCKDK